jgi:hypothetical protein
LNVPGSAGAGATVDGGGGAGDSAGAGSATVGAAGWACDGVPEPNQIAAPMATSTTNRNKSDRRIGRDMGPARYRPAGGQASGPWVTMW